MSIIFMVYELPIDFLFVDIVNILCLCKYWSLSFKLL